MVDGEFKPNMYPIMYWALLYGVTAGVALFIVFLFSKFITLVWFPVFLTGVVWGGWRNYQRQKQLWQQTQGSAPTSQNIAGEFREAAADISRASQDLFQGK